ncbi:hypothetical protein [Neisseria sp. HMSC075C12]|nr:hypothetical protein [Neisseria sp. HMSC075C12]
MRKTWNLSICHPSLRDTFKLTPSPRPDDSDGLKEWAAYSVTHAG